MLHWPLVTLHMGAAQRGLGCLRKGAKNPTEKTQEKPKDRTLEKGGEGAPASFRTCAVKELASTGSGQEAVFSTLMGTELESAVVSVCGKRALIKL